MRAPLRAVEIRGAVFVAVRRATPTCYPTGAAALETYGAASDSTVSRFIVDNGVIATDQLTVGSLVSGSPGTTRSPGRSEATSGWALTRT